MTRTSPQAYRAVFAFDQPRGSAHVPALIARAAANADRPGRREHGRL
jgi:hypothetical protein